MELKVNNLREILKRERKKVAFLSALLGVFLYVWIPLMKSSEPETAPEIITAEAAKQLAAKKEEAAAADASAEKTVAHEYPALLRVPLPVNNLTRNPFLGFPVEEREAPVEFRDRQEPVAESALREEERTKVESMTVTSIMLWGRNPSCVVDGVILEQGSRFKGFVIKEIYEDRVFFSGQYGTYPNRVYSPLKLHNGNVDE
jgi:hypothetical protein